MNYNRLCSFTPTNQSSFRPVDIEGTMQVQCLHQEQHSHTKPLHLGLYRPDMAEETATKPLREERLLTLEEWSRLHKEHPVPQFTDILHTTSGRRGPTTTFNFPQHQFLPLNVEVPLSGPPTKQAKRPFDKNYIWTTTTEQVRSWTDNKYGESQPSRIAHLVQTWHCRFFSHFTRQGSNEHQNDFNDCSTKGHFTQQLFRWQLQFADNKRKAWQSAICANHCFVCTALRLTQQWTEGKSSELPVKSRVTYINNVLVCTSSIRDGQIILWIKQPGVFPIFSYCKESQCSMLWLSLHCQMHKWHNAIQFKSCLPIPVSDPRSQIPHGFYVGHDWTWQPLPLTFTSP